ncbi:hypothetical protein [Acidiphilium sp.]|uniref:hypothetical protein n=1 Tax=Acidiphilium sp. TaxID=527 RepID=UPI003CFCD602
MNEDVFGFANAKQSTAERIKTIRPDRLENEINIEDIARADAAGERVGFKSRENNEQIITIRRRRKELGPTTAINTRAPQSVAIPFISFCESNRFSYWEGIQELMKRSGLI